MKKKIIIAATFTACLALCAAVWPQSTIVEKTPTPNPMPTVTAPQPTLLEPKELALPVTPEKKMAEVEPAPEAPAEELSAPTSDIEKQPEAGRESALPTQPEPEQTPAPEQESTNSNSGDMVYVPGFGWIESQGLNHVDYAEDMYENGNNIGSMG